jgi:lysozyme family protein
VADVDAAITYVLSWEDSTLSGKITTDSGGRTRFGIAEKFSPQLTASLFYTTMGAAAALVVAKGIYNTSYAEPLHIADIANQDIANKLLSLGVNIGLEPAARMLQEAVSVPADGHIGTMTLMGLSVADPLTVLADMRALAVAHYRAIVAARPADSVYLNGWLARANA